MERCNSYFPRDHAKRIIFCGVFLFFGVAAAHARNAPVSFSSPPYTCVIDTSAHLPGSIIRDCLKNPEDKRLLSLKNMFDSLGFFRPSFDTQSRTISVNPGPRSLIDSLCIKSKLPCAMDSIEKGLFPRFYDAGEIQGLARKVLFYFGCRGSPFARLSVSLTDTQFVDIKNPNRLHKTFFITFDVQENGTYAFAKPILVGKFKTSARLIGHDIVAREGSVFDLRKVEETRQRLMLKSYISSVEPGNLKILKDTLSRKDTSDHAKTFSGNVVEPFVISDIVGLGIDGAIAFEAGQTNVNSLTGLFSLSLNNIFHRGEVGSFSYKGEQGFQRLEVSVSVPYLFGLSLFGSSGFGLEVQENSYGYLHGELKMLTELWPFWQGGLVLQGHEITRYVDSVDIASNFEGVDFVVAREGKAYRAGLSGSDLEFKIGSGLQQSQGQQLNRWHIDLNAGAQAPFNIRYAVAGRVVCGSYLTDARDTMQVTELYRTGGYKSIRGYTDNEFAFKTVLYEQLEFLYYFSYTGSTYIFLDAGAGFNVESPVSKSGATKMLGYGVGIRIPVKIGNASFEWARNYKDTQSWGRIHISVQNSISAGMIK